MDKSDELARRLLDTCQLDLEIAFERGIKKWSALCESPIETLLLCALTFSFGLNDWVSDRPFRFDVASSPDGMGQRALRIIPQFYWQQYRIDFAVFIDPSGRPSFFVECDGHLFHERTPEQAERDRSRDRAIQKAGIPIIRFTGREIYRNPFDCALQLIEFAGARMKQ